jgi:ribosomal protein L18
VKTETASVAVAVDTTNDTTTQEPKAPAKTATITLTAPGGTVQIVAERKGEGARVYVITTDTEKKSARGMTASHQSFEAAKAASEKMAAKAVKMGWTRTVRRAAFTPKPDAFTSLPTPPAAPASKGKSNDHHCSHLRKKVDGTRWRR